MTRLQAFLIILVLMVAGAGIYGLGTRLNYLRYSGDVVEELMYFPSGRSLKIASLGYETLVSDLLWLKGLQYYGEHRKTDRDYPLAEHIFSTITDLDPLFVGAYRFGAFVLAQDVGQPLAAIELLRKGMRNNPDRWELPFDIGFIHFIQLKDNLKAAHYFRLASRFGGSPEIAKRFSAFAFKRAGRFSVARSLWEEIYRSSSNRVMRETAEFAIKSIILEETLSSLRELLNRLASATGRSPSDLGELVRAGLIPAIPHDPFGGEYFLDPDTGMVLSTTKVRSEAEAKKEYLERNIERYFTRKGHYPQSLSELKNEGLINEIPLVIGAKIRYNAETGTVGYVFSRKEL